VSISPIINKEKTESVCANEKVPAGHPLRKTRALATVAMLAYISELNQRFPQSKILSKF
jgi:hypothetical protein